MSDVIARLTRTIAERQTNPRAGSYTASLFEKGLPEIAKKVGEEGVEVAVAALAQDDERVLSEMADLIYHGLVLLAARQLTWEQVEAELAQRFR